MALGIWRKLQLIRPSVIHARNWGAWPDTAAARLMTFPRAPLIFSYHGMEGLHVSVQQRLKFQAMARITSRIFAVSEAARQLLVEEYGLIRENVGVIGIGVDTERFRPREEKPEPRGSRRLIVGYVGRFFRIKNVPLLIRSVARLVRTGADLELHIAGEGPEGPEMKKLASDLGLADRVRFFGDVENVSELLRTFDMYVLSSDNEANPNSLLEAMASGLPCISTDVGNVRELLDHGRVGLLVPPGDDESMAIALKRLADEPGMRAKLGDAARRRVIEHYSMSGMLDAYEALYRDPARVRLG
jgi:glycosyltransferase involved in cell wall biosynthesis